MLQMSGEHTPQAGETGSIQEHDRVTRLEPNVERPAVIPIHNPCFLTYELFDLRTPLRVWRWSPTSTPVQTVQVNERKARAPREATRESRLARPAATDYENSFQLGKLRPASRHPPRKTTNLGFRRMPLHYELARASETR